MKNMEKEISKDMYDRGKSNHGFLKPGDYNKVFSAQEVMGYGIYNERLIEREGKYFVAYQIGDSCD